jgi:ATP-dependent Clp protease ATP-binding subunit ClpC
MRLLEDVLAEEILSGRVSDGDTAMVDIDEEGKVKVISGSISFMQVSNYTYP